MTQKLQVGAKKSKIDLVKRESCNLARISKYLTFNQILFIINSVIKS